MASFNKPLSPSSSVGSALFYFAQAGNIEKLELLGRDWADSGEVINWSNTSDNGISSLYAACREGHIDAVKILLSFPAIEVNKAANNGYTSFHTACINNQVDCVRALLAHKDIDVNQVDNDGETALFAACFGGEAAVVKLIIEHPSLDVNKQRSVDGWTPLFISSYYGQTECVRALANHPSIDIHKAVLDGRRPLDVAQNEDVRGIITEKIIVSNANKKAPDSVGQIMFSLAKSGQLTGLIGLLEEWRDNAIVNWANPADNACSCLYVACREGHTDCVRLLVSLSSIDINMPCSNG